MDVILQILKTKEIGIVKFGEPDFTQLTGLALVLIAIALISIFTMKEAQDQREYRNEQELLASSEQTATSSVREDATLPSSSVTESEISSPQATKKPARGGRTPSRGRTPKKEARMSPIFFSPCLTYSFSSYSFLLQS